MLTVNGRTYDFERSRDGVPFRVHGRRTYATALVIHETVTTSHARTVEVLRTRGSGKLGIHVIGDVDGSISQHADLGNQIVWHSGAHNSHSIGYELINPYYPESMPKNGPWQDVIDAPWAHKKRYVLPMPEQVETFTRFVQFVTSGGIDGLKVPLAWPSVTGGTFHMKAVSTCSKPTHGVYSHFNIGNHSDGSWPLLYAWLRIEAGLSPYLAYSEAVRRAEGSNGKVYVGDLENRSRYVPMPEMPWTEEDEKQVEDLCPGNYEAGISIGVCLG